MSRCRALRYRKHSHQSGRRAADSWLQVLERYPSQLRPPSRCAEPDGRRSSLADYYRNQLGGNHQAHGTVAVARPRSWSRHRQEVLNAVTKAWRPGQWCEHARRRHSIAQSSAKPRVSCPPHAPHLNRRNLCRRRACTLGNAWFYLFSTSLAQSVPGTTSLFQGIRKRCSSRTRPRLKMKCRNSGFWTWRRSISFPKPVPRPCPAT